jgi:hypothetical protein
MTLSVMTTPAVIAAASPPKPPMWDARFTFQASMRQPPSTEASSVQYFYDYTLPVPTAAQVMTNSGGQQYTFLTQGSNTWRIDVHANTGGAANNATTGCCLCNEPQQCGGMFPPRPDWLQPSSGGVSTYLGTSVVNERECHGWSKEGATGGAQFGWYTSVKTGAPCQFAFLSAIRPFLFTFSYYSTDDKAFDNDIVFHVPKECPRPPTPPPLSRRGDDDDDAWHRHRQRVRDVSCGIISMYDPSWQTGRYNNTHWP